MTAEAPEQTKAATFDPANAKLHRINFLRKPVKAGPAPPGRKHQLNIKLPDLAKAAIFDPANAKLRRINFLCMDMSAGLMPTGIFSTAHAGVILSGVESCHIWIKPLGPLPSDVEANILLRGDGERKFEAALGDFEENKSVLQVSMEVRFTVAREGACVFYELSVDAIGRLR